MRRAQPKSTVDHIPRSLEYTPNAFKSPAPPVVVACWCGLVEHMDREHLDCFTRSIWRRFDAKDLEPLKARILARREELARQREGSTGAAPRAATEPIAASE